MLIDHCVHTFEELATSVLPSHFKRLEAAIQAPMAAENLVGFKGITKELLSRFNRAKDFPGCYVFIDGEKPIYVDISRGVMKRLIQHLNSKSHYSAGLVYRMASEHYPNEMKREQAMKDEQFKTVFFSAQESLRQMKIAFVEIDNDLELYTFEVFVSMKLDTNTWNTFRTH